MQTSSWEDSEGVEEEEESPGMALLAFKGFPVHTQDGKGMSTSDADDRQRYCSAPVHGGF